eukprot:TRINITY_DN5819_c0_g2_i1.p1 TRINITY_DN5819_c0_g2~~TRINITY_DN5819_c0_g2_i1.p1  ORF type:complete len:113 (+),score=10.18 TRINITY_DN5819_c0_g2_i1:81-419(+)
MGATGLKAVTATPARAGQRAGLQRERVRESEQQGDGHADQEGSVDQTGQNEHLGLQVVHQLGLTCRRFEEFAAHQRDADGCADGAQTDDETASQCDKTQNVFHDDSYEVEVC